MHRFRPLIALVAAVAVVNLTACATDSTRADGPTAESDPADHGRVDGAREVAEPQLALLAVDDDGAAALLDLLDDSTAELDAIGAPLALASDGRYAFVTTDDGLEILDSGRWSWDHGDHFHYSLAEPRTIGTLPGEGEATVATGSLSTAGATGVFFAGSGEAVLLDNAALADGEIVERFRLDGDDDTGIVAPLGDGAIVSDLAGGRLVFHTADGVPTDASADCADPAGTIATTVGVVVGCAAGAVLARSEDTGDEPSFETIPYPAEFGPVTGDDRATAFDGRRTRPTVAAIAGARGFWLLDTRDRGWQLVETTSPLARVTAVDDADGHVVAVDQEGRVRVYSAETGAELAATEPLVDASAASVSLVVDGQRAYVNDAAGGVVLEIDYADGARVARTLETPAAPVFFTEVGR
ncbi:ABC transporter [Agromyces sp. LHK192]|uniref:ABC transporter n=1 Tax=Agromyces sp. LHK192 TaxID=2498704 RepID=UPI000FDC5565|nr:ABC transporter [Agromyces sp. LHK192]